MIGIGLYDNQAYALPLGTLETILLFISPVMMALFKLPEIGKDFVE